MGLESSELLAQPIKKSSFVGTTGTATLDTPTTAGNRLIIVIGSSGSPGTPAGLARDSVVSTRTGIYSKLAVDGESSWALTGATSTTVTNWVAMELVGIDPDYPVDVISSVAGSGGSSGTTAVSNVYDGVAIAALHIHNSTSLGVATYDGHTNGFQEVAEEGLASGTTASNLSVAQRFVQTLGQWETSATPSGSQTQAGVIVVYAAAGAKYSPVIDWGTGFEYGPVPVGSMTLGLAGAGGVSKLFDVVGGNPTIADQTPRNGTYCLECAGTSAVYIQKAMTTQSIRHRPVRVPIRIGSTPTPGDTELLGILSTENAVLRYQASSGKLGLKIGTGTEQLSDQAVTLDQWFTVELLMDTRTTAYKCDWKADYADDGTLAPQTQATFTAGSAGPADNVWLGRKVAAASGPVVRYDDPVVGTKPGHHPMGDHVGYLAKVDPTDPIVVSGSTANFGVMTAGSVAAWNAANAKAAIDEVPANFSGSADALVGVTGHASDYVEIPMEPLNLSPAVIRAVFLHLPVWAASGTAATMRARGWNGSTETLFFSDLDPGADNSATPPWAWIPWRPAGGWTWAKLAAAAIRLGFADATPDLGPHVVYLDVIVQVAKLEQVFGSLVTAAVDPAGEGIQKLYVDTTGTLGGTLYYEVGGTPTSVRVDADQTHTEAIEAADLPTTNVIRWESDPEPPE